MVWLADHCTSNAGSDQGRSVKVFERLPASFRRLDLPLNRPILDLGCGRGGCAIALAAALEVPVHGIDISPDNVRVAREACQKAGVDATFAVVDAVNDILPDRGFGLVLLRDVAEHVRDLHAVMTRLRTILDEEARLYVTFPPWRGPYAGHQHNAQSIVRFMPYLHALAPNVFLGLLRRWESDRTAWLQDEEQICTNRLTRHKFESTAMSTGWEVQYLRTYLLRPAFMRMGLPTISNGFLGRIPFLGESLSTACEYVLAPRGRQGD